MGSGRQCWLLGQGACGQRLCASNWARGLACRVPDGAAQLAPHFLNNVLLALAVPAFNPRLCCGEDGAEFGLGWRPRG